MLLSKELDKSEKDLIAYYRIKYGWDNVYNIADGGTGGWSHVNRYLDDHPEVRIEANRKAQITRYLNKFYDSEAFKLGLKKAVETKRRNGYYESESFKYTLDCAHSKEARIKAEATMRGRKNNSKILWLNPDNLNLYVMSYQNKNKWHKNYIFVCDLNEVPIN